MVIPAWLPAVLRIVAAVLVAIASVLGAYAGITVIQDEPPSKEEAIVRCAAEIPAGVPSRAVPDVEDLCPEPTQPDADGIVPPTALAAAEVVKGKGATRQVQGDFSSPALYSNGRIPASLLCGIPGGRLRCDAARAWNAMHKAIKQLYGVLIWPLGSLSSYRDLAGQRYLYARSRPGWAAVPGTSNHGLGIAVDLGSRAMRAAIDRIGARFGWAKRCSDASWEWWHIKYNPACTGATFRPGSTRRAACKGTRIRGKCYHVLRRGHARGHRPEVRLVQRILDRNCIPTPNHGKYTQRTRRSVKRFQRRAHQRANGIVSARTWRSLLKHRRHRHRC